ncbi:MAG: ABC transporter permease [Armatimonadetes bacterium]|nr:ABC transporter permease [Armatimonadota bacterium]
MNRTLAVAWKEVLHLVRDRRSLVAALGLPVILLLLYGAVVDFDLKHLPFVAVDHDRTAASRRLLQSCAAIESFRLVGLLDHPNEVDAVFARRQATIALVIPPGFQRAMQKQGTARLQILVDGADPTTGSIALTYALGAVNRVATELVEREARAAGLPARLLAPPLEVRTRVLYNPNLKSRLSLVPGLIGVILMMLSALLTSGVVVRERERGSFELLASSPIAASELIVGKLLPYLVLAGFDVVLVVALGWAVFGVVPQGNLLLLFAIALVYVAAALALGLLFSCLARTQQTAMLLAFVVTVVPTMLLSGFAFPIRNMPWPLQAVARIVPATHFIVIARAIILKGVGLGLIWRQVVALGAITGVLVLLAVRRFRKTL